MPRKRKKKRTISCQACGLRAVLRRFGYDLCKTCITITDKGKLEAAVEAWSELS